MGAAQPDRQRIGRTRRGYTHWVDYIDTDNHDGLDRFEDHYPAPMPSLRPTAEHILEETEAHRSFEHIPDDLRGHVKFDVDAMATDTGINLYITETTDGGVHMFDQRIS